MKSWVMALYMASISAGNAFTAATSAVIGAARLDVSGASYYAFFTCVMLVAALLFLPVARCYKVADHVPGRVRIGDEGFRRGQFGREQLGHRTLRRVAFRACACERRGGSPRRGLLRLRRRRQRTPHPGVDGSHVRDQALQPFVQSRARCS